MFYLHLIVQIAHLVIEIYVQLNWSYILLIWPQTHSSNATSCLFWLTLHPTSAHPHEPIFALQRMGTHTDVTSIKTSKCAFASRLSQYTPSKSKKNKFGSTSKKKKPFVGFVYAHTVLKNAFGRPYYDFTRNNYKTIHRQLLWICWSKKIHFTF